MWMAILNAVIFLVVLFIGYAVGWKSGFNESRDIVLRVLGTSQDMIGDLQKSVGAFIDKLENIREEEEHEMSVDKNN